MPLVHLVGDPDTDGDRMLRGPENDSVYVGSSPGAGGSAQAAAALGAEDLIWDPQTTREHLEAASAAIAEGYNVYDLEIFDYAQGSFGGRNPITGQEGPLAEQGSDALSGGPQNQRGAPQPIRTEDGSEGNPDLEPQSTGELLSGQVTSDGRRLCTSNVLNFRSNASAMIRPELCTAADDFARNVWGRALDIGSGYRSPEYNSTLRGAARNSYHCRGMALDIGNIGNRENMLDFVDKAARHGFTGIGVYWPDSEGAYFVHIDIRETKYHWGPRGGSHASQYADVKQILRRYGFPYCG